MFLNTGRLLVTSAFLLWPALTDAQPQWDVAGFAALFAGHTPAADARRYHDDWFHTGQAGVTLGRYFSPHLKVEAEASLTGTGRLHTERLVTLPEYPHPHRLGAEIETSLRSVGAAMTWQFRDNEWVHPFVRVGASADFETRVVRSWDQYIYPVDPREGGRPVLVPGTVEGPVTATRARLVAGGGAKFYMTPHAFVRTEAAVALGRARQDVMLRVGLGFDLARASTAAGAANVMKSAVTEVKR